MTDIGKGDWVICIDNSPHLRNGMKLTLGALYQIENLLIHDAITEFYLVGINYPGKEGITWLPYRFKAAFGGHEEEIRNEKVVEDAKDNYVKALKELLHG